MTQKVATIFSWLMVPRIELIWTGRENQQPEIKKKVLRLCEWIWCFHIPWTWRSTQLRCKVYLDMPRFQDLHTQRADTTYHVLRSNKLDRNILRFNETNLWPICLSDCFQLKILEKNLFQDYLDCNLLITIDQLMEIKAWKHMKGYPTGQLKRFCDRFYTI